MSYQEFQAKVSKKTKFERVLWYTLYSLLIIVAAFFIYNIITSPVKYKEHGTYVLAIITTTAFLLFGFYGYYLIPNRYKIISVPSNLEIIQKSEVLKNLLNDLKIMAVPELYEYNYFEFGKSLSSWGYCMHLGFDSENFYISLQSKTGGGRYGGGFVDFGATERLRKKIKTIIQSYC